MKFPSADGKHSTTEWQDLAGKLRPQKLASGRYRSKDHRCTDL